MRALGIDFGTKKVGVALSDDNAQMAFPEGTFRNDGDLLDTLARLIEERNVNMVVFGHSKNYAGVDNPVMAGAKKCAESLKQKTGVAVEWESEVLTSAAARRIQSEQPSRSRKALPPVDIDASAAALILQGYLDRTRTA